MTHFMFAKLHEIDQISRLFGFKNKENMGG